MEFSLDDNRAGAGSSILLSPEVVAIRTKLVEACDGKTFAESIDFLKQLLDREQDEQKRLGILAARVFVLRQRIIDMQEKKDGAFLSKFIAPEQNLPDNLSEDSFVEGGDEEEDDEDEKPRKRVITEEDHLPTNVAAEEEKKKPRDGDGGFDSGDDVASLRGAVTEAENRALKAEETVRRAEARRDVETAALESRVREAIGQKDEIIAALTRQLEDRRGLMA